MRIIVAPDSYKGSLPATTVAAAMTEGILSVFPAAQVLQIPIADGGEGTVEALVMATKGRIIAQQVQGPVGNPVLAHWGILGDKQTAVIEMAAASGLNLVKKEHRNPNITTSFGTGELIKAAWEQGINNFIIGIGGSATNDAGTGMLKALGARFLDSAERELPAGGASLANLAKIDLTNLDPRLATANFLVACDVKNPLCGPQGASIIYGPQKGATPDMAIKLDNALQRFAFIAEKATGKKVADYPGAGAAGGLGAGFLFFTNARLQAGVSIVLEAVHFAELAKNADLIITGEGKTDFQTAYGKAPLGVAQIASKYNIPVICLSGGLGKGNEDVLPKGISALMSIVPGPMPLADALANARELVLAATARLCRLLAAGRQLALKQNFHQK